MHIATVTFKILSPDHQITIDCDNTNFTNVMGHWDSDPYHWGERCSSRVGCVVEI